MVRRNSRYELRSALTFPLAASLAEGSFTGVVASKYFNASPVLIALIIVGSLAANGIAGEARTIPDVLLLVLVILLWDYLFNVLEYNFPRLRRVVQDSPTLLIHNGHVLKQNLRKERLTEQELAASLRKQGVADLRRVKQAILEVDGQISVVENE